MALDGSLGFARRGPVEQAQAQINGGGVMREDRVLEFDPQVLVQIKFASATDQNCNQVCPDACSAVPMNPLAKQGAGLAESTVQIGVNS